MAEPTTFKKIEFENLSAAQRAQMAANAESFTQIVRDESGKPVINQATGRVETYTPTAEEYYNIRGGVNRAGYFGDAYIPAETSGRPYLTEEEYFAALEGKTGVARGGAINLATAKKQYDLAISQGKTSAEATAISGYDPKTGGLVTGAGTTGTGGGDGNGDGAGDTGGDTSLAAFYANLAAEEKRSKSLAAFEIFRGFLRQYGLEALASDVEKYKLDGLSDEELLIRLRTESKDYKQRFKANEARITKGLRALSEAEYIGLEDQYQDVMRRYGLPETYYSRGAMGRQEGFEKFIAGDVSPVELEDRIQTAQNRVLNAPTQIKDALSQYYGAEISNGDVLAYVLDPDRALPQIQRKITAAEIGGAAAMAGLGATRTRAEELGTFGVTSQQAREGFQTIAEFLPSAQKLGDIYAKQGLGPYTQAVAEQEVFGVPGAADAATKRRRLAQLETAAFSGQVGITGGALARERAGQF
jgi:hypothetical protein